MDSNSWKYLISTSSRQLPLSRSDVGGNEYEQKVEEEDVYLDENGEEIYTEFPCPYCDDDFDLVELCCHVEHMHFSQAKSGVCPVCAVNVSSSMIAHLTKQHGKMIKIQHKMKSLKGKPDANLSLLLKEFHEEYLKSVLDSSSIVPPQSATEPDPLLSSFFYNVSSVSLSEIAQSYASTEPSLSEINPGVTIMERETQSPPLSDREHEERARKSKFVRGLVWCSFLDDNL